MTVTADDINVRTLRDDEVRVREATTVICNAAASGSVVDAATLRGLSAELLANIPDDADELLVIPDGPLHALPWSLLTDEQRGGPVGIHRSLVHAASATSYFALVDRETTRERDGTDRGEHDLLLVADPSYTDEQIQDPQRRRLMGSAVEAEMIEKLVGGCTVLRRKEATEARVVAELPRHRRAHFACHALEDPDDASHSGLLLAPPTQQDRERLKNTDDLLETWEVEDLRLACDMVVLAACSTATGNAEPGEGLVGLAHAFQLAGTRQVLAALWPVDDAVTARFMKLVYERMRNTNSLQEAVRGARASFATERPAHWAPWIVFGPSPGPRDDE